MKHAESKTNRPALSLRTVGAADEPFLFEVYASTRMEELAPLGWGESQQRKFLQMQFLAQSRYYQSTFDQAEFLVILLDGAPVGRLYLDRRPDEIRIVDIALLPPYRKQGIGTQLLNEILDEARTKGLPVRIHVEKLNPALGLYERLGFRAVSDKGVYLLMEWSPP